MAVTERTDKQGRVFVDELLDNGNTINYERLPSGTCFHVETPQRVREILEDARLNRFRVRVVLGDVKTGRSWEDDLDVAGYVGRSTGTIKIPLLVYSSLSLGGPAILDHCIIGIRHANRKNGGWFYRHPLYKVAYFFNHSAIEYVFI